MTPAPYPADTRAKGWRFELDLERIQQSDTWALAEPEARPWLLMIWCAAWQQTPCGSLPGDERILCARIGVASKFWARHRDVLLRGWELADDGRLYHSVIVEQVQAMLARKAEERQRKADYRARMEAERAKASADVPRDKPGTDTGPPRDSGGRDDTGTGTGTGTGTRSNTNTNTGGIPPVPPARATRPREAPQALPPWVDAEAWSGFENARKAMRKPLTAQAQRLAIGELQRLRDAGQDPTRVLQQSTFRGWAGLFPVRPDDTEVNGARRNGAAAAAGPLGIHGAATARNAEALERRLFGATTELSP
jgi:hypothetical protein